MGIELEDNQSIIAPGHNPKETPEMFVSKIIRNQKRMNKSIEIYEGK